MKKLLLVLTVALFMSGCAINFNDDLFAKKKECAAMRNEIEQRLENLNNETREVRLSKIFYSPKLNTCMYTEEWSYTTDDNVIRIKYTLYDVLTNEGAEQEFGCTPKDNCEKETFEASRDFDKLVEKYE